MKKMSTAQMLRAGRRVGSDDKAPAAKPEIGNPIRAAAPSKAPPKSKGSVGKTVRAAKPASMKTKASSPAATSGIGGMMRAAYESKKKK